MCRQGAPALVASPLPIQPYATFSCRTARHHAVDRPGRWRGRQRGAQQDQRSERRLDCHHRGVGIRSYGRGVCRRQLQRRALEPRRDDRPRLHRQVRLGEGACVYRGAAARRVARRRDRVARLSATLARDGEPGSQAGRVLHRARHPQDDRQSPHRSHRHLRAGAGCAGHPDTQELEPRIRLGRGIRAVPGRYPGVGYRPFVGWADRLRDQPGARPGSSSRARRVADRGQGEFGLGVRVDPGRRPDPRRPYRGLPLQGGVAGMKHILALDQGTTSSRAIVFDHSGSVVASAQKEFRQIFPRPGWVEHDATEIWATQLHTATEALGKAGLTAADIAAVGITNQRETTVVWDRETGEPVHHAIVWQDRRTAAACDRLKARGLAPSMLPAVCSSSEVYGETVLFGGAVPIAGIAGDQQAALFGQACTQPGMVKNTYGTGCFMLMNTGTKPIASKNNLLTTVAWRIGSRTEYALEGSIFIAGAVVQWLRDGLGIIKSSSEIEALASQVDDTQGVYLVPAFAGLGAPHWDQYARGLVAGVTRRVRRMRG